MKKILIFLLLLVSAILAGGCAKGEDTVDFTYAQDSRDPRVYHFQAKGHSDFGTFVYSWDFGQGNTSKGEAVTHNFETYGSHMVSLTADIEESGVHTTVTKNIIIDVPQIRDMDFTYSVSKSDPKEYYFQANSKSDFGTVSYEWDFGNNNVTSGDRVNFNFEEYGFHEIKLKAKIKESEDITSDLIKSVEIPMPEIRNLNFTYTVDKNDPRLLKFVAESAETFGTIVYKWDFGDGNIKSGQEVSNKFTDYGEQTVKLTAELVELKKTASREDKVFVKEPLIDNFDFTYEIDENNPLLVYFTASGNNNKGTVNFEWNFGRGNTDAGKEVSYQFDSYGEKTISLTGKNSTLNIQDSFSKTINLTSPQIKNLDFTVSRDKKNPKVAVFKASSESDYEVVYEWDFGDGITRKGILQNVSFDYFGQKYITLTASIPAINVKTKITKEYDFVEPIISSVNFTYEPDVKNKLDVYFKATGKTDLGELEFFWDFGRGVTANGKEATNKFQYYDTYPVQLTARVKDTDITYIVNKDIILQSDAKLVVNYSYNDNIIDDNGNYVLKANFAPTLVGKLTGLSYKWDFDDTASGVVNNTSTLERPEHTFTKSDLYHVKLCVEANELIDPLCITTPTPIIERPRGSLDIIRGKYWLQGITDTWWRSVHVNNIWKHLYNTVEVEVTTTGVHLGCYDADDKGINTTVTANNYSSADKIHDIACWAEHSTGGYQKVTYYLKKDKKYKKTIELRQ